MKRKKLTKIIVCALVMGAFSFVTILNPFAKEEVFSNNNDYLFLTLTQFDPNGVADSLSWTYNGVESPTLGNTFGINSYPDLGYYPCYARSWSGFTPQDSEILTRGQILLMKQFGTDTSDLLMPGIYISSITCVCTVGYQSGFTVNLPTDIPFYESNLLFNGKALDRSLYTLTKTQTGLRIYTMPDYPSYSFVFRNHRFTYTFNTPLLVEDYDHWSFGNGVDFRFDGYGFDGLNILFGHSGFLINYSTAEEFETGSLSNNSVLIGDLKNEVDDLINDMHVPTVDDSTIDDILGSVDNSSVEDVAGLVSVFDNDLLSVEMSEFLSLILIASLGIAFTGYALHGKRG